MMQYCQVPLPEPKEVIKIDHLPEFDIEDYDLTKSKNLTKFFFAVERICRQSWCYQRMIQFLRQHSDMNKCAFYKNVSNLDCTSIHIHAHHSPFTLFDIVSTVYQKRLALHESIEENDIAQEVMWNHYRMVVGLIPISETVHELVHNGFLFIPTTAPFGYYKEFYRSYEPFIDPELKRILATNEHYSAQYEFAKETKILNVSSIYIDPTGSYEFPKTEDIIKTLQTRIDRYNNALREQQENALAIREQQEGGVIGNVNITVTNETNPIGIT